MCLQCFFIIIKSYTTSSFIQSGPLESNIPISIMEHDELVSLALSHVSDIAITSNGKSSPFTLPFSLSKLLAIVLHIHCTWTIA